MAATDRTISQFDQEQHTWENDCEITTHLFMANAITNEDKTEIGSAQ